MELLSSELPPIGTNAYLLADPERGEAIVIDAPEGAWAWASGAAGKLDCSITALVLTHGHWDHTLDAHRFAAAGVPVHGHPDDRMLFEQPSVMSAFAMPGLAMVPVAIDAWLRGGEPVTLLGRAFGVREVPGHCPGSILLHLPEENLAFVGDAIFAGGVGRFDLPGGDFPTLERSIREQVYTLPAETRLLPGHGPATQVDRERAGNPFVSG